LPFPELSANACPEEDKDYEPKDVMDVDARASPRKGKRKVSGSELEEREGAARCVGCAGRRSRCWVDPAWIKKWKEMVAHGVVVGHAPLGVACKECSGRKQKCYLPELSKEWAAVKPTSKRKRDEGEQAAGGKGGKPQASGSREKAGAAGEGAAAPMKKQRVEVVVPPRPKERDAPWAAKERDPGPDIVTALVNINNSMVALARAVTESNDHLWVIAEYVDWLKWGVELDESDKGSEEWDSGDKQVVCESDKNIVNKE